MAAREQRQYMVAATDPTLAWLRLFMVALTAIALLLTGTELTQRVALSTVLVLAGAYAAVNSVLGLYRRYRRLLTRRVYVAVDLAAITALVYLTGGAASPYYLLFALPLVVAVAHHGLRAGAIYCLSATVLYGVAASLQQAAQAQEWLTHSALLWALFLVLGYVIYADDIREEKARRRDELGALHRAAAAPMHTGDLPTVADNILTGALGATNCSWGAIYLYDNQDDRFTTVYSLSRLDREAELEQDTPKVVHSDVLFTVLYTGSQVSIHDMETDRRVIGSVLRRQPIRSAVISPLVAPGARRIGIMVLGRDEPHRPTQHENRFVGTISMQAAVAINTAFLFEEAASIEAAKEADKLRTQLLGTVSHELRTPIAAIQGFASSLRASDGIDVPKEVADDWIAEIEENAERLKRLVADLLDLSRLEAGALRMNLEWQDMADVVEDMHPNLARLAGTRNVSIQCSMNLPLIKCDSERIGQVLNNLVENAAKFSPPDSNIVVGAERYGNGIRIGVLDEGQGIPAEQQDKIFERFYQVEGASFRPQKGTGLGLAICRNIVEAHGGNIWVESRPEQGSIFYLTLPVEPAAH